MKKRSTAAFAGICGLKTAVLAVIVLCLIRLGGQAYSFGYRVFAQETVSESPGRNVAVTISEGMSGKEIGELLEGRGLIRDQPLLPAYRIRSLLLWSDHFPDNRHAHRFS